MSLYFCVCVFVCMKGNIKLGNKDWEMLQNESMLNDNHIVAFNILIKQKYAQISGFADPIYCQSSQNPFQPIESEGGQIHHCVNVNHWVCSFYTQNELYYMNSLFDTPMESVEYQMSQVCVLFCIFCFALFFIFLSVFFVCLCFIFLFAVFDIVLCMHNHKTKNLIFVNCISKNTDVFFVFFTDLQN